MIEQELKEAELKLRESSSEPCTELSGLSAEQSKPSSEQIKLSAEQATPNAEQAKPSAEQGKPSTEQAKPGATETKVPLTGLKSQNGETTTVANSQSKKTGSNHSNSDGFNPSLFPGNAYLFWAVIIAIYYFLSPIINLRTQTLMNFSPVLSSLGLLKPDKRFSEVGDDLLNSALLTGDKSIEATINQHELNRLTSGVPADDPQIYLARIYVYARSDVEDESNLKEIQEAATELHNRIKSVPAGYEIPVGTAPALRSLAMKALNRGNNNTARLLFLTLVDIFPFQAADTMSNLKSEIAGILAEQQQYDLAFKYFSESYEYGRTHYRVQSANDYRLQQMSYIVHKLKDFREAQKILQELVRTNRRDHLSPLNGLEDDLNYVNQQIKNQEST